MNEMIQYAISILVVGFFGSAFIEIIDRKTDRWGRIATKAK